MPNKIKRLTYLNEAMAHKPWCLNEDLIETLSKPEKGDDEWGVQELVLAGSIFATYHSLCGLVFGQGIKEEIDLPLHVQKEGPSKDKSPQSKATPSHHHPHHEEKVVTFL